MSEQVKPENLYCFNPVTGKRDGQWCVWEGGGKCLNCQAADRIKALEAVAGAALYVYRTLIVYDDVNALAVEALRDKLRAAGYNGEGE